MASVTMAAPKPQEDDPWTAPTVDARPASGAASAPAATSAAIDRPRPASDDTTMPSSDTTPDIRTSTSSGPGAGSTGPANGRRSSKPSDPPSAASSKRWRSPGSAMAFAAQANMVATLVLNGEIDLDTARTYASVARTVAQAMSTEVSRARFVQSIPQLDLSSDVFDEEPS